MNDDASVTLSPWERLCVNVTQPPWFALYLVPAGFLVFPVFHFIFGAHRATWAVALVLFGLLFALRCGTACLRRLMPVSRAVKNAWFETRTLAKRYDSYQCQKLFWVGLGILIYAGLFAGFQDRQMLLAVMCLVFGGAGIARWRSRRGDLCKTV